MADLGQDQDSLELKVMELEYWIRQKYNAKEALLADIDATALNIKRIEIDKKNKQKNVLEIDKQIEVHKKDLQGIKNALQILIDSVPKS